jgi:carboxypeptidase family protein
VTYSLRKFVLLSSLLSALSWAQVDTGAITGTVKDPSGGIVAKAVVKIDSSTVGSTISLLTNNSGLYSQPGLKPGVYSISASAPGFNTVTKTGIEVRVQDRVAVDFDLPIGTATSTVSVESAVPAIETETTSLGSVVEERTIKNLPLNGRNYIQLATLAPGTSPAKQSNERNTFVANGARSIQNSYLLDGIDNKNKIVGFDNSSALFRNLRSKPAPFLPSSGKRQGRL